MAKVKIQGNASGTGVLTVTAPNTSTDRTITLPDTTGELLSTAGGTMTGNISHASNLTLDVGGDLYLDSDGGNWRFNDGGTDIGLLKNNSSDFQIEAKVQDKDIKFVGNDGGSAVTALTLDMSDAGKAIFNSGLAIGGTGAANTLDDYETGTFTATLTSAPTAPTNPPTATGNYTKVGNWVHFTIYRFDNANTSGASGEMKITGLPFSAATTCVTQDFATHSFSFDTSKYQWANIGSGSTTIAFLEATSGGAWSNWNITAGTGKYLTISGSYRTS